MMGTLIRNEGKAGRQVWLGDGLVRFDDAGYAVGVVKRNGQPLDPPAALNASQIDHATRAAEFGYVVEEGEVVAEAPEPPQEVAESVDEAEAAEGASDVESVTVAAATVLPDEEAPEPEPESDPDVPDLDEMTKREMYKLAQELDLGLEWTGTTSDEFREAIRAHYGVNDAAES